MRLARILGAVGRGLISAGVIVLLFVGYQLWGTGLQHQQAQGSLESDFLELLDSDVVTDTQAEFDATTASVTDAEPTTAEDAPDEPAAAVTVDLTDIDYSPEFLAVLYPEDGESLARIEIPDINVDQITVAGVSVEDLRKGPGHYGSTPNPGQAGNSAIAGHRTTYGAPFHRIDELEPGASIFVTTIQGTFEYRVKENIAPDGSVLGHFIVSPSDTWVLGQESGENLLTLTACHPKYSARQRIIVQAELVGDPAPTIPREGGESLSPIDLSSGAEDEAAANEIADESDAEPATDTDVVISDAVAADGDPTVDADGNPIDANAATDADVTDPGATDDVQVEGDVQVEDDIELTESDIELTNSPFAEPDDFGEGLNGDSTKVQPAIMWGIAALSIWVTAWFVGKRLNRKWTLYTVGVAPFFLVLWACFVNVDQALPSY